MAAVPSYLPSSRAAEIGWRAGFDLAASVNLMGLLLVLALYRRPPDLPAAGVDLSALPTKPEPGRGR